MRKFRKLFLVLPAMGTLMAALAVTPAASAHAQATPNVPSECDATTFYNPDGGIASCGGGTGHFRVIIYCTSDPKIGYGTYYTGPWVLTQHGFSITDCPSSQPYVVAAGWDLANW